ncbi:hypothetical protein ACWATR_00120 [Nostoc sp. UIC 10890]
MLTKWGLSTSGKEFGLLPTPKAQDGIHPGISTRKPGQTLHLSAAVIPTPTKIDANNNYRKPTKGGRNLCYEVDSTPNRSLNPLFVSAIMGFPNGWVNISYDSQTLTDGCVLPHPQLQSAYSY